MSENTVPNPLTGGNLPRVLTVTSTAIHSIPGEVRSRQSLFFGNKVVLGFKEEFSITRAQVWVRSYNQRCDIHLEVFHELPNSLFVVQFDTEDWIVVKRSLLAASPGASPLSAGDIYVVVNDYTISFDPCNQGDFRHLVTVNIPKGNPTIYSLIKCIINIVGTFVKGVLGSDHRHIFVIAETRLKLFPAHGQFQLLDIEVTTIFFVWSNNAVVFASHTVTYHRFAGSHAPGSSTPHS